MVGLRKSVIELFLSVRLWFINFYKSTNVNSSKNFFSNIFFNTFLIFFIYAFMIFIVFYVFRFDIKLSLSDYTFFSRIIYFLIILITLPLYSIYTIILYFYNFFLYSFLVNISDSFSDFNSYSYFKNIIGANNVYVSDFVLALSSSKESTSNEFTGFFGIFLFLYKFLYQLSESLVFSFTDFENISNFYNVIVLNLHLWYFNFFLDVFNNYLDYPLFILFGLMFCFTSFISLLTINYLGFYGVFILNLFSIFFFWISLMPYLFLILKNNNYYYISFGKWMYLNVNYKINFDFFVDNISLSFAFLTVTIAVFVYMYAFSYFRYEPLVDRLILLLNTFVISMVFLVFAGNTIMLFLGWEMIGLTSFFLINFWATRIGTLKAAFKAFSFNKVSDMTLFFAILLIFNLTYDFDILSIISQIHLYENFVLDFFFFRIGCVELIAFFLVCSAFIKSAQLGAHIWLPDSMEAPVPASALIHSATLVSAGIFLLLRFSTIFELNQFIMLLIGVVGSLTAFYGGLVSAYQSDTKRVLAYSTISHCGFLMVIYTTGVIEFVLLYLYVHGFFKAAVFLSVGNINRFSKNNQDFKKMGQYYKYLPFDCLISFIGLINLCGLPFTFGFYIKHLLFVGLNVNSLIYYFVLANCLIGALTGLFYSYRLYYNVFFDIKKSKKMLYVHTLENNLNSKFYSNINFAAYIAIFCLMFVSYVIILYCVYIYLSSELNFSNFGNYFIYTSFMDNLNSSSNFLLNLSIINWIVIFLGIAIIFTPWRSIFIRSNYIDSYFYFVTFCLWFFIFYFFIF